MDTAVANATGFMCDLSNTAEQPTPHDGVGGPQSPCRGDARVISVTQQISLLPMSGLMAPNPHAAGVMGFESTMGFVQFQHPTAPPKYKAKREMKTNCYLLLCPFPATATTPEIELALAVVTSASPVM